MKNIKTCFFIFCTAILLVTLSSCSDSQQDSEVKHDHPNVILIMTDDQGIGDFGFMGNPYVQTANLDKLAAESLHLTNFYVSPVCAPTRASLMTGRYSERTGVYDTFNGGAVMDKNEVTIAEALKSKGYTTAIFGKWHLGDNYPYRPIDQGFDEALVHRGGGVGQPGDYMNYFAKDSSYFNPVLFHNGVPEKTKGYCSDVYSRAAMDFIRQQSHNDNEQPFFIYLSYNAPHTPLQLPMEYYQMYRDIEFDFNSFSVDDEAVTRMTERDVESAKRVYGMVTNIDDNLGKLMEVLEQEGLGQNTIVVFLTDNGPQQVRYKYGLRDRKSSVYSGGVRVPCLIRYPERFQGKEEIDTRLAHIDLFPSILSLCGIDQPDHDIDGINFFETTNEEALAQRTLFFEWGRGFPVKYRNVAAIKGSHKLVGNIEADAVIDEFEVYDLGNDPYEQNNIVVDQMKLADSLKNEIDDWYEEIITERNNKWILPAYVGTEHENPTVLNRNDAKGTPVPWGQDDVLGYWDVKVMETARYDVSPVFIEPINEPGNLHLKMYPHYFVQNNEPNSDKLAFKNIELKEGEFILELYYRTDKGRHIFPLYVSIEKLG